MLEVSHPSLVVDRVLAAFVLEARRADGKYYPGSTLKNILSALFRVMKKNIGAANLVSFVEKSSREKSYPKLHNAMDWQLRMLRNNRIGVERKRAQIITADIEVQLWAKGILGCHSPQALLNSVFFYNGKLFCLRGVNEHLNLLFSQLRRSSDPDCYTYMEYGSKNHSGGINDKGDGKVVSIVATNSPRCHVAILDLYFSKVPQSVSGESKFYLTPLPFTPTGSRPWFFPEPHQIKKLQSLLKTMCSSADIKGNFTNHSLRATGATVLFDAGVPESLIQKRTGHKSLDALRTYERVTQPQEQAVADILADTTPQFYEVVKERVHTSVNDAFFLDNLPSELFKTN